MYSHPSIRHACYLFYVRLKLKINSHIPNSPDVYILVHCIFSVHCGKKCFLFLFIETVAKLMFHLKSCR